MSIIRELLRVKSFKTFAIGLLATFSLIATVAGLAAVVPNHGEVLASGDTRSNSIIPGGTHSVSQLKSKFNSLDAKGRAAFAHAGVNPNQCSNIVLGATTRDNRVVVGNRTVASNVYTYGRGYMSGSTQVSGGAWMRHPSVSFRSSSIPSYVCMDGGSYKWAVINSCGNPVKAPRPTTPKRYHFTIQKKVTKDLSSSTNVAYMGGRENVVADYGQTVRFVSMTTNDGNVTLNGALYDKLPAGLSFVSGKWQKTVAGKVVQTGSTDRTGAAWYVLKPGEELKIDIKAKYNSRKKLVNYACTSAKEIREKKCDTATVTPPPTTPPPPPPPPVVVKSAKCESLTGQKLSYNEFKFTTVASVKNGARITGYVYDFGDNQTKTINTSSLTNSVNHSFARTWKYAVKVTVKTTVGNKVCYTGAHVVIPKPAVTIDKKVDGVEKKQVEIGKDFTYQLVVKNTGQVNLKNVEVGDLAPAGVKLKSADKGEIFENGSKWRYTIPELKIGQSAVFNLTGVVEAYQEGELVNTACVNAKEVNPDKPNQVDDCDDATVTVVKPDEPFVSCDALNVEKLSNSKYKFTAIARATNGAEIRFYSFNFDDGTDKATTDNNVVEHEYTTDGNYNPSVDVTMDVKGKDVVVTSDNCKANIVVETPETPTPETPVEGKGFVGKSIPDTGAGDIIGMFFATALAGTTAYRFVWIRRYN